MRRKTIIFKIWLYILNILHKVIIRKISYDITNLYVVYYSNIINDIYICENGESALELVELCTKLNEKLNRPFTKILYGEVDLVFKYKMVKVTDLCFTWDATDEERRKVCSYIVDTPIRNNKGVN
jgi:hypothetical protein